MMGLMSPAVQIPIICYLWKHNVDYLIVLKKNVNLFLGLLKLLEWKILGSKF